MSTFFKKEALEAKLEKLTDTQESVTVLSQYFVFHRNQAEEAVDTWLESLSRASIPRRLGFLHLANDILQHTKRKGEEFVKAFGKVLPDAITTCSTGAPSGMVSKINRLINIWDERRIFDEQSIRQFKSKLPNGSSALSDKKTADKKLTPNISGSIGNGDTKKSVSILVPPSYEAPLPFVKIFTSLKNLEKKRLAQGGRMATEIEPSITDESILNQANDPSTIQSLMSKVNSALTLTAAYRSTMQEEWTTRENLMFELRKVVKELETSQAQLNGLKANIEMIENEFLSTKRKLGEKS